MKKFLSILLIILILSAGVCLISAVIYQSINLIILGGVSAMLSVMVFIIRFSNSGKKEG